MTQEAIECTPLNQTIPIEYALSLFSTQPVPNNVQNYFEPIIIVYLYTPLVVLLMFTFYSWVCAHLTSIYNIFNVFGLNEGI